MTKLIYECMKCGKCCHEIEYKKRIPLYPEEANVLIEIAKKRGLSFKIIEDLVFFDILNNKILVITYKILFDKNTNGCPFYDNKSGCTIHDTKPLACKAYPLALKQVDAFNFQISLDPLCHYINGRYTLLKNASFLTLKEIFKREYPNAHNHFTKNKKIILKIKQLEFKHKIKIVRQISLNDSNKYLNEWEREEITTE